MPARRRASPAWWLAPLALVLLLGCARDTGADLDPFRTVPDGAEVLVVLPDTQIYSLQYPEVFDTQTEWIAAHAETLRLRFVAHLGDVTDRNSVQEWERARAAMGMLDGVVSYGLVPGNHDYGPGGDASTRDTLLNDYFEFDAAAAQPSFGGAYVPGRLDNSYHLVEIGGRQLVFLFLEWGPRDEVVRWANEVMTEHADRQGVLVTHAYLNNNDNRYDHTRTDLPQDHNPHLYGTEGGVNDGEELWQKLVRHHDFILTLNGHVLGDGEGYLRSDNDLGGTVHQLLSNYQTRAMGGEGYLRLLIFMPDGETVRVSTYSPLYGETLDEARQNFDLTLSN